MLLVGNVIHDNDVYLTVVDNVIHDNEVYLTVVDNVIHDNKVFLIVVDNVIRDNEVYLIVVDNAAVSNLLVSYPGFNVDLPKGCIDVCCCFFSCLLVHDNRHFKCTFFLSVCSIKISQ